MLPPGSLLLAGLPATGKSSFGTWLEPHKGYFHLDFDEEALVHQRGFGQAQDLLWHQHQTVPLIHGLLERQQPIALSWGFAPHFLPTVSQLLPYGFVPIWFTATPTIAWPAVIARGGIDVRYFDQYLAQLRPLEADILAVFGGHVLQPLHDDGTRLSCEMIYTQVSAWLR